MPFSLKMSQDVFQLQMDQGTDHLSGIIAIHDDICMIVHTPEEHDEHLLSLIESAKTHGIVFNSAKVSHQAASDCLLWCSFHWPGHVTRPLQNQSLTRPSCLRLTDKVTVLSRA